METVTDPRERLVRVGNEILDQTYEIEKIMPDYKRISEEVKSKDQDRATSVMKEPGSLDVLIRMLELTNVRDRSVREYVTLRQTIEALTGGAR
jgi:hypothetical protein